MKTLKRWLCFAVLFAIITGLWTVSAANIDLDALPSPEDVYAEESPELGAESVPEEFIVAEPMALSVGNVYLGTMSATITDYFKGVMSNHAGDDYVAFRSSRSDYYLFWGKDLENDGDNFTGSGSFVRYNSDNGYVYRGTDSISVNGANGFVYSNMNDRYAAFDTERGLFNEKILIYIGVFVICLWVFSRILFWRKHN